MVQMSIWRAAKYALIFAAFPLAVSLAHPVVARAIQRNALESPPLDPAAVPPEVQAPTPAEQQLADDLWAEAKALQATGDYRNAERAWRRSVELATATWGPRHPVFASRMGDLGVNLYYQGRYDDAEPVLRTAAEIDIHRLGRRHLFTLDNLNALATNLQNQGRTGEAESIYRRAIVTFGNTGEETYVLGNLATNLLEQGRYAEAVPLLRRVLQIDIGSGADQRSIATDYSNLGSALELLGSSPSEAEKMLREALNIDRASLPTGHPELGVDEANLAFTLDHHARWREAEDLYRSAISIYRASVGDAHPDTATALTGLAANLYNQGRTVEAEAPAREALKRRIQALGEQHTDTLLARRQLANIELALGNYEEAIDLARLSLGASLTTRTLARASASEAERVRVNGLPSLSASILTRAVWTKAAHFPDRESDLRDEAFQAAQAIDISGAGEALQRTAARTLADETGAREEALSWRRLQDKLARVDEQLAGAAAAGAEGDNARTILMSARQDIVRALLLSSEVLQQRVPRFFDLVQPRPVNRSDLQSTASKRGLLRPDEVLILLTSGSDQLSQGKHHGMVFAVSNDMSAWAEIPLDASELNEAVGALRDQLVNGGSTFTTNGADPGRGFDRLRAYQLYLALFGATAVTAVIESKRHWLLVPQGSLLSLPFAALVATEPRGGASGDVDPATLRATSWLATAHTLAILPSVSALRNRRDLPLQGAATTAKPTFFGIGDPAFRGTPDGKMPHGERRGSVRRTRDYFRGQSADFAAVASLPRLAGSGPEIRALARSFGAPRSSYLLQTQAREAAVRKQGAGGALSRAAVVAFATHGLLSQELQDNISEPALALTPPMLRKAHNQISTDDGLLTSSEVARLRLSAQWVILSACNTAGGQNGNAEGLSGLARAFLYAGARSVLVSHYSVFDDAARFLTTNTVKIAAKEKLTRPDALQRAMMMLMQDGSKDRIGFSYAHPTAWAPFELIDAD